MPKLTDDEIKLLALATAIKANPGDNISEVAKQVMDSYIQAIEAIKSLPPSSESLPYMGLIGGINKT